MLAGILKQTTSPWATYCKRVLVTFRSWELEGVRAHCVLESAQYANSSLGWHALMTYDFQRASCDSLNTFGSGRRALKLTKESKRFLDVIPRVEEQDRLSSNAYYLVTKELLATALPGRAPASSAAFSVNTVVGDGRARGR